MVPIPARCCEATSPPTLGSGLRPSTNPAFRLFALPQVSRGRTCRPRRQSQRLPHQRAAATNLAIFVPLFDNAGRELFFSVFCVAAAVLVAAGVLALGRTSPRLAVALVTVGALVGGLFLAWTLVGPILALALIVLFARGVLGGSSVAD